MVATVKVAGSFESSPSQALSPMHVPPSRGSPLFSNYVAAADSQRFLQIGIATELLKPLNVSKRFPHEPF
jgi:hypothetical protein